MARNQMRDVNTKPPLHVRQGAQPKALPPLEGAFPLRGDDCGNVYVDVHTIPEKTAPASSSLCLVASLFDVMKHTAATPHIAAIQVKPWAYMSLMGADNSLGSTAPTTPDPPFNYAGDSALTDLLYHYGGEGGGGNANLHMVNLVSDLNPVTNVKWRSGLCYGSGVLGHYNSSTKDTTTVADANTGTDNEGIGNAPYSGDTGFEVPIMTQQGRFDSSDPHLLETFLRLANLNFPATYRCLILWGHSYAWCPDALLEDRSGSLTGTARFMPIERDPFYTGRDNVSLQAALIAVGGVDVLGFDSGMGMSLENIYLLRHGARYVVGNCDYTGWRGMDHRAIGNFLRAGMSGAEVSPWALCKTIVDNFAPQLDGTRNFAVAAYATSAAVAYRAALCQLSFCLVGFLRLNPVPHARLILAVRRRILWPSYTTGDGGNGGVDTLFADATRIFLELQKHVPSPAIQDACTSLIALLLGHANPKQACCGDGKFTSHDTCKEGGGDKERESSEMSYRHASDAFAGLACINLFFPQSVADYNVESSTPDATPYAQVYAALSFNTDSMPSTSSLPWSDFLNELFLILMADGEA